MSCIPVFVINLDRATERLANISGQCERVGIAFERIPAVDGSLLTAAEMRALNPPRLVGGEMSSGEIGCYASHLRALQTVVERGLPRACIMEDDVTIGPGALAWLAPDAPLPSGCGILKIEGLIRAKTSILPILEYAGQRVVFSPQFSFGAAAYIVTLDAARRLLPRLKGMGRPVDHVLFHYWEHGVPVYEVHPFVVWQNRQTGSDIEQNRLPLLKFRKPKTPVRRLHKRFTRNVAAVRIALYEFQHYGFRMFQKLPIGTDARL